MKDFTTVTNVTIVTNVIPVTHVTTFVPHVGNNQEMLVSFINTHISVRLKCVQKVGYGISLPNQTH